MMDGLISTWPVIPRRALLSQSRWQEFEEIGVQSVSPTMKTEGTGGMGVLQLSYLEAGFWIIFKTNFADDTHTSTKTSAETGFRMRRFFRSRLTPSTWVGNRISGH